MTSQNIHWELRGNSGGRRLGQDRRHFSYSGHIPERRCLKDRRSHNKGLGLDTGLFEPRQTESPDEKIEGLDKGLIQDITRFL